MIRLYRLSTGEELIGEPIKSETSETHLAIKKPFVLIPMHGQPGRPMQIGFHPYVPYTKDEIIKIKQTNIITETTPDDNMLNAYKQNTSPIVQAKPKIIV